MTDRATAITKLQVMVLADEVAREKVMNLPVLLQNQSEARRFLQNWMIDNAEFVDEHFGKRIATAGSFLAFCLNHKLLHNTQARICRISIKLMLHIFNSESIPSTQHMELQLMQTHCPSHLEYFLGMKTKITGAVLGICKGVASTLLGQQGGHYRDGSRKGVQKCNCTCSSKGN